MAQIEKLYQSIQNLGELGIQLPDKLIDETNRVEEEIIKNDIIPALAEAINPVINQIQREIVLVVEYVPDEPLSVRLTRKHSLSIPAELDMSTDKKHKIITERETFTISSHTKSSKTTLRVKFSDGRIISHRFAYDTIVDTIKNIGYDNAKALSISCCGVRLVSNTKDDCYTQDELARNVFVMTHSSTRSRKISLMKFQSDLG